VDAIVLGDGELTCEAYLDALEEGRRLDGILGLWFRDGDEVIRNEKRRLIEDVDQLPIPDYDVWEEIDKYVHYNQMIYVMGNRGCPYACSYCSEVSLRRAIPGKGIRRRSPRPLAHEVAHHYAKYRDAGMRIAHFFDPVFSFDLSWTEAFCDEYVRIGMADELPFSCFAAGASLDQRRIEALARASCKIIRIGIESGSEQIRREVYQKDVTDEHLRDLFRLCHERGIHLTGYTMIGGPGEDLHSLLDTFKLVRELEVDRPIFFTYRPLPATRGAELVEELGGRVRQEEWDKIDSLHTHCNVETGKLKPWQIGLFRNLCIGYFNLSRTLRLIAGQKHAFFLNLTTYLYTGLSDGVGLQYLIGYFMVCAGDNLTR
jgi:radical SAM superfamily enzyme YgiQ (UPF0313 family)